MASRSPGRRTRAAPRPTRSRRSTSSPSRRRTRTSWSMTPSRAPAAASRSPPLVKEQQPLLHAHQRPGRRCPRRSRSLNRSDIPRRSSRSRSSTTSSARRCTTPTPTSCTSRRRVERQPVPLTDLRSTGSARPRADRRGRRGHHGHGPAGRPSRSRRRRGGRVDRSRSRSRARASPALPLTANPGGDQTVEQGVTVTLNGGASTGNIDAYEWTGPDGITHHRREQPEGDVHGAEHARRLQVHPQGRRGPTARPER